MCVRASVSLTGSGCLFGSFSCFMSAKGSRTVAAFTVMSTYNRKEESGLPYPGLDVSKC